MFHYAELIGDPTDLFTILRTNKGYAKHHITYKTVGEGLVIPDGKRFLCIFLSLLLLLCDPLFFLSVRDCVHVLTNEKNSLFCGSQ